MYGSIVEACRKCGALTSHGVAPDSCGECEGAQFDSAVAAGVYERALAAEVWRLKKEPYLSARARNALDSVLQKFSIDRSALLIPVPQSRKRDLERGFNQAEVIAEHVAKRMRVRVARGVLVRTSHTPMHRVAMDRKARAVTVENAFEVKIPRLVNGRNIVLIDDVLTSGSTASSCAQVLKKNGAERVNVITLARAVMRD